MPFNGFICEATDEPVAPPDCLTCARKGALPGCEFTPAILSGILRNQRPPDFSSAAAYQAWTGKEKIDLGVSVTELLGCARKARLMTEYAWAEKPGQLYYAYRGGLFHGAAAEFADSDPFVIAEMRLFYFFRYQSKVVGLSGQPDLLTYRADLGGWWILDYKTIKEVPNHTYRYLCPNNGEAIYDSPYRTRGKTVNCPHCMFRHPIEEVKVEELPPQPRGSHVEQIQLYALLIEQNRQMLAHRINEQLLKNDHPAVARDDAPVVGAELSYMDMSRPKRILVPIWDRSDRVRLLRSRLDGITASLPAVLSAPDDLWQCDYCPVCKQCETLNDGPVGKEMLCDHIRTIGVVPD